MKDDKENNIKNSKQRINLKRVFYYTFYFVILVNKLIKSFAELFKK